MTQTITTEAWFAFKAYNTQTQYGYGTETQAEAYADHLNKHREINLFAAHKLSAEEAQERGLNEGYGDSFNLEDCDVGDEEA